MSQNVTDFIKSKKVNETLEVAHNFLISAVQGERHDLSHIKRIKRTKSYLNYDIELIIEDFYIHFYILDRKIPVDGMKKCIIDIVFDRETNTVTGNNVRAFYQPTYNSSTWDSIRCEATPETERLLNLVIELNTILSGKTALTTYSPKDKTFDENMSYLNSEILPKLSGEKEITELSKDLLSRIHNGLHNAREENIVEIEATIARFFNEELVDLLNSFIHFEEKNKEKVRPIVTDTLVQMIGNVTNMIASIETKRVDDFILKCKNIKENYFYEDASSSEEASVSEKEEQTV